MLAWFWPLQTPPLGCGDFEKIFQIFFAFHNHFSVTLIHAFLIFIILNVSGKVQHKFSMGVWNVHYLGWTHINILSFETPYVTLIHPKTYNIRIKSCSKVWHLCFTTVNFSEKTYKQDKVDKEKEILQDVWEEALHGQKSILLYRSSSIFYVLFCLTYIKGLSVPTESYRFSHSPSIWRPENRYSSHYAGEFQSSYVRIYYTTFGL